MSREHLLAQPRRAAPFSWQKSEARRKMDKLLECARWNAGHAAARYPDLEPMLVTDAPFDDR